MTKGVWKLQDVRDETLNSSWVTYDFANDSGTLFAWGSNNTNGAVGDGTVVARSSPVQIPGTQWSKIKSGASHSTSAAIKTDGTLWVWGENSNGLLGINLGPSGGVASHRSSPVQIPGTAWCDVGGGVAVMGAIKSDNTLWVWGCNATPGGYNLGNNLATGPRSSPTQIPGTAWCKITGSDGINTALKTDGTLWVWGCNTEGRLGDDTTTHRSSPTQIPGTSWCNVYPGVQYSIAIKTDGTLWGWGRNLEGQLGQNTSTTEYSSPIQIPGTKWTSAATSFCTVYATKSDGTLWSWGKNNSGQLGNNTAVDTCSPVQIPGTKWTKIIASPQTTTAHALKSDGTLWGMGSATNVGLATNIDYSSPIQIPGSWIDISGNMNGNAFAKKSP